MEKSGSVVVFEDGLEIRVVDQIKFDKEISGASSSFHRESKCQPVGGNLWGS